MRVLQNQCITQGYRRLAVSHLERNVYIMAGLGRRKSFFIYPQHTITGTRDRESLRQSSRCRYPQAQGQVQSQIQIRKFGPGNQQLFSKPRPQVHNVSTKHSLLLPMYLNKHPTNTIHNQCLQCLHFQHHRHPPPQFQTQSLHHHGRSPNRQPNPTNGKRRRNLLPLFSNPELAEPVLRFHVPVRT